MRSGLRIDLLNLGALLAALVLASLGSGLSGPGATDRTSARASPGLLAQVERLPDGQRVLRDARGVAVPLRDYRRIASGTLVADRVLADLCEPDRIVAFSRYAAKTPSGHRYAGKPTLGARADVERVLVLKPDLLVVNELVD